MQEYRPLTPNDEDCCGSGCQTCVFDLHKLEVKRWENKRKQSFTLDDSSSILNVYEYKQFIVDFVEKISEDIWLFSFVIPGSSRFPLKCGQHIVARCYDDISKKHVIRPYTPVSKLSKRGVFKIAVKLYSEGMMSRSIKQWKIGSSVEWRGPFGEFNYIPNKFTTTLMISAGTGVTPMIQIIREIVNNEDDVTRVCLLHSVAKIQDVIMADKLHKWTSFWNFKLVYCITKDFDSSNKLPYNQNFHLGRINRDVLNSVRSSVESVRLLVLICGPSVFNEDMKQLVAEELNASQMICF